MLIPLKHLSYSAVVSGMFAQVTCEQEYKNEGSKPIEAVYVFPMPDNASIIGCNIMIGKRQVEAKLKKQEEAKAEYDEAVEGVLAQGKIPDFTIKSGVPTQQQTEYVLEELTKGDA